MSVDGYKKPCLDSSVFIGGLNREICDGIKRGIVFDHLWECAEEEYSRTKKPTIFISALTLVEVFKKQGRDCGDSAVANFDKFISRVNEPFVEVIEIDGEMANDARELCRDPKNAGLRPNDALHIVSAIRGECDVLLAWDGPLTRITHDKVRIEAPRVGQRKIHTKDWVATPEESAAYTKWQERRKKKAGGSEYDDQAEVEAQEPDPSAPGVQRSGSGPADGAPATQEPPKAQGKSNGEAEGESRSKAKQVVEAGAVEQKTKTDTSDNANANPQS